MTTPPPNVERLRRPLLSKRERRFAAIAFSGAFIVLGIGWLAIEHAARGGVDPSLAGAFFGPLLAWFAAALLLSPRRRRVLMRRVRVLLGAVETPTGQVVHVVDGDTIDDLVGGVRYRLENIDAPETGRGAACRAESSAGAGAKRRALKLIARAQKVTFHPIGRTDMYGRTIAFVRLDGRDLGEILIAEGHARPWSGARESWCGARGWLARLARDNPAIHGCDRCFRRVSRGEA